MTKKPQSGRGKRVVFDEETWRAIDLLVREQMKSFDEIPAEAFRDVLRKYGQPDNLKAALKQSVRAPHHDPLRNGVFIGGNRSRKGPHATASVCILLPAPKLTTPPTPRSTADYGDRRREFFKLNPKPTATN
jgi:hypothetical protein